MKKLLCLILCLGAVLSAAAQTQTGIVKTKGRQTSRGRVQPGTPLGGVTVRIKGRTAVVTKASGSFSFPMPGRRFSVVSVSKPDYVLNDPDVLTRQYSYSPNPFYLVMETRSQQIDDKLEAERKIRENLQNEVKRREQEIERLKAQNQLTREQYQQARVELYALQRSNEALIAEIAEKYAMLDYDQMDEFKRQLDDFLLNGDLVRADSLMRAGVGDIDAYIAEIHSERAIQEAEQADLDRRAQNLKQSQKFTQAKEDRADQVCYGQFVKFVMENEPDSAAAYIERRAGIDADNVRFQFDAASYFHKRGMPDQARYYYDRALSAARQQSVADNEILLAHTLNNVAMLCSGGPDNEVVPMFQEALSIYRRLAADDPQVYQPHVASTLNNLALHYSGAGHDALSRSEPLLLEALDIYRALDGENAGTYRQQSAQVLNNLGVLYDENSRFNDSEQCYIEALDIYRALARESSSPYDADVASTLNNLSTLYYRNGQPGPEGIAWLNEAVEIYRRLAGDDLPPYGGKLAAVLTNLAQYQYRCNHDAAGDSAASQALDVYRLMVSSGLNSVRPDLALKAYEQGVRCFQRNEMDQSEHLFSESVMNYRELAELEPSVYDPLLARSLRNQAAALDRLQRWDEGGKCYQQELEINRRLARTNPSRYVTAVGRSLGNLAGHYLYLGDFDQAIALAGEGLACDGTLHFIQANLALAHLCLGHTAQAMELYERYKAELKDTFLDDLQWLHRLGRIPPEREGDVRAVMDLLNR